MFSGIYRNWFTSSLLVYYPGIRVFMGSIPIRFLQTKLWVDHFPLSELSMDNLPSEIKLQIINFLPLESVKLVMSLNKDLWNLCHSSSHWKNVKLVIDSWNVKTVLANNMLSQCRRVQKTIISSYHPKQANSVLPTFSVILRSLETHILELNWYKK